MEVIKSREKINILFLIASLNSGGAERQLVEFTRALAGESFHPHILIYHNRVHFREIMEEPGITLTVMEKKFKYDPLFPLRIARYAQEKGIHLIHSYTESAGFWGRPAGKLTGIGSITHLQTSCYSPGWFRLERAMGWMDKLLIANSHAARDEYLAHFPERDVRVVHNGLNFNLIPDTSGREKSGEGRKIIAVGRISPQKNYPCLLRAIHRVKNELPGIQVDIWGRVLHQGSFREVNDLIEKLNLGDVVKYRGTSDRVIEEIADADLMILSSSIEGFPNVILESLACRVPVIASDVGDIKYAVKPDETGFLFPSGNDGALADTIKRFFTLPFEERKMMGKSGCSLVRNDFSTERLVENTVKIYREILP